MRKLHSAYNASMSSDRASFSSSLIAWQQSHGRNDLPWQGKDPYRVWLSEIMLQQTQVATVIPYYLRFVDAFPSVGALAQASEDAVLACWSGLGYYARGRNLHKAARMIMALHGGVFPKRHEDILNLPGVGRSTAAAISAQAFGEKRAILDGNVRRVLARHCGIAGHGKAVEDELWRIAESLLPDRDVAIYTQALMDMGAMLCKRSSPMCGSCPVRIGCVAFDTGRVHELPTPKPRKRLPERHARFLIALNDGMIMLERRGSRGIWGGLWSLPQLEDGIDLHDWEIVERIEMPGLVHTFTHFRLCISPVVLRLSERPKHQGEHAWMRVDEALQAAIPAPVRNLLLSL